MCATRTVQQSQRVVTPESVKRPLRIPAALKLLYDFSFVTRHLLQMLWATCPWHLLGLLTLIVLQAALPYWRWQWFGRLIDSAAHPAGITAVLVPWYWFSGLVLLVLIIETLAKKLSYSVEQYFSECFAPYLPRARQRFGMSSFQRGSAVFNSLQAAERAEYSARYLVDGQFLLLGRSLTLMVGIAVIARYAPLVGLLITAASLLVIAVQLYCAIHMAHYDRSFWSDKAEATNLRNLFTYKERMKSLLLFGIDDTAIEQVTSLASRFARALRTMSSKLLSLELLAGTVLAAAFAAGAWLLVAECVAGQRSQGQMAFLVTTMITVGLGMKGVVEAAAQQALGADKIVDLFRFMHGTALPQPRTRANHKDGEMETIGDIRIEGLTFGYEEGRPVLCNATAIFPAGKITFLVGSNGAGKTTLLNVLSHIYPIPEGCVFIGSLDVSNVAAVALRHRLKHLGQDSLNIRLTVRQLLAMAAGFTEGASQSLPDVEERMWKALSWSCLDDKVRKFKRGLDEPMAVWREAEEDLSGGQHRKLNIAMLFMGILSERVSEVVLDEPFHGIEPRHARKILEHFRKLPVTLIVVSHDVDRIPPEAHVVFLHRDDTKSDSRTTVYDGTHRELLRDNAAYREYCSLDSVHEQLILNQVS